MRKLVAVIAGTAMIALIFGLWYMTGPGAGGDRFAQCRSTRVAGSAPIGAEPFTLTGADGAPVSSADLLDEPALIYFGYTFCPDVCPIDAARNALAVDIATEAGYEITPVFITVDPERDTPDVVGEFAAALHPEMVGLTGSSDALKDVQRDFRVYSNVPDSDDPYYLVDHTAFSYLTLPDEGVVEFFNRDVSAEAVAERAGCFIDAS